MAPGHDGFNTATAAPSNASAMPVWRTHGTSPRSSRR